MSVETGRVHAVQEIRQGSVLTAAFNHLSDTTISLDDVTDFDEAGGSAILDDGTTTSTIVYSGLDDTANTLTVTSAGTASFVADDAIYVEPEATERFAHVILDGEGDEGEPMVALIPNYLWDRFALGTRAANDQEWVIAERIDDVWTIVDILGIFPTSDGSIGGGHSHDGTGTNSTVVGGLEEEGATAALAAGDRAVAIGDISSAAAADTVAVGYNASAQGINEIAIGSGAVIGATATGAIVIGQSSSISAAATDAILIGRNLDVTLAIPDFIGIGRVTVPGNATAGTDAIAIGRGATLPSSSANVAAGIAIGRLSRSQRGGIAIGDDAQADGSGNGTAFHIAIGVSSRSTGGTGSIAIGNAANASTDASIAIGRNSSAAGAHITEQEMSVAIGMSASAGGLRAIAIGYGATASGRSSIAMSSDGTGTPAATASGDSSIALGPRSDATATDAIAIGDGAQATHTRGVAIGRLAATRYTREVRLGNQHDSTVSIAGSLQVNLVTRTADYTIPALGSGTSSMETITRMDATSANRTVNLPPAIANEIGRVHIIRKIDASANTVTIARNGTDTIDGAASVVLTAQHDEVMIYCAAAGVWHSTTLNGGAGGGPNAEAMAFAWFIAAGGD